MKKNIIIWLIFQLFFPLFLSAQLYPPVGPGNTFSFNGNTHINIGDQVANGVRTIEMWFKLNGTINASLAEAQTLVGRDYDNGSAVSRDEFAIYFRHIAFGQPGKLVFYKRDSTSIREILSDQNNWEAHKWYHVAVVIDPVEGMKMYINGVLQMSTHSSTIPIGTEMGQSTDATDIGRWGEFTLTGAIRYFEGQIDDLRFWTTARSQTEIRAMMCHKLAGNEPGLRAYYRFDEIAGTTLEDLSAGNYDGTAFGTVNWQTSSAPIGDTSTYVYPAGGWAGQVLAMPGTLGDTFYVSQVTGTTAPECLHIYRVDTLPNTNTGIIGLTDHKTYYGAWTAFGTDVQYDVTHYFEGLGVCPGCEGDVKLFSRNDNAKTSWTQIPTTTNVAAKTITAINESSIDSTYRAEYILVICPPLALPGSSSDSLSLTKEETFSFSIFPNPTHDVLSIRSPFILDRLHLALFTTEGKRIFQQHHGEGKTWELDLSVLPKGVYLLYLESEKIISTARIIIK